MKKFGRVLVVLYLVSCKTTSTSLGGTYSGLYELPLGENTSCHFVMKKAKDSIPTVVCHDAALAWAVPLQDFAFHVWAGRPLLTVSGSMLAFLGSNSSDKISVLVSTDQGKNWDINPSFEKKQAEDVLVEVIITKTGRLSASFKNSTGTLYKVEQAATFQSKFSPLKEKAKLYPEHCFNQHEMSETKIPTDCLSGYLMRLLK